MPLFPLNTRTQKLSEKRSGNAAKVTITAFPCDIGECFARKLHTRKVKTNEKIQLKEKKTESESFVYVVVCVPMFVCVCVCMYIYLTIRPLHAFEGVSGNKFVIHR